MCSIPRQAAATVPKHLNTSGLVVDRVVSLVEKSSTQGEKPVGPENSFACNQKGSEEHNIVDELHLLEEPDPSKRAGPAPGWVG